MGAQVKRILGILALCSTLALAGAAQAQQGRTYRVLHVMSYHSPMGWSDGQFAAFQEVLAPLAIEYRVLRMEANRNRTPGWAEAKGREARDLIASWKPDLVYATDDDAQEHVTRHYVNRPTPFVVSGVNKAPEAYGFAGAKNIAGVLEPVHIAETLRLLHAIVPQARRFAIVTDEAPSMVELAGQVKRHIEAMPGAELVALDVVRTFEAYQRAVKGYHGKADAIWPLGVHGLADAQGRTVSREEVMRWTAENSRLPDLAFWSERVEKGTLVAVIVSSREQGLAAGRIARGILAEGRSPASFGIKPDMKGVPMISLARANKLGLKVKSGVLLSAEVLDRFDWERR
jgi:ABC-type uncharacterized transport system substrate-binding protein